MRESLVTDRISTAVSNDSNQLFTVRLDKQKCPLLVYSVFVILVLFEPDYIATTPLHWLFRIAKYVAALSTIVIFLIRKINLNGLLIGTTIFEMWLLLSTVVNSAAIDIWIKNSVYVIVLVLFAQILLETDIHILPLALSLVLGLYTHINTLCRILYPDGMYTFLFKYRNCWFLGYDNPSCMIIHLAITVALFRIFYYKNHFLIWDWSVLLSGFWFIFIQNIATVIIAELFFAAFLLISVSKLIRKLFSKGTLIITGMFILFLLIQLASIQDNALFSLVFSFFGKSTTFTGRSRIWAIAWKEIQAGGWIVGKGLQSSEMYLQLFGGRSWVNVHSYYLQVLFEGGVPAFVILFGVLTCAAVRFDKRRYGYAFMPLLAGLLAIMMMWQAEAYGDLIKYGFVILSFMYNADLFVQDEEEYSTPRIQFVFHRS